VQNHKGKTITSDLAYDPGEMRVNEMRLSLTTYSNLYSRPNPGTICKSVHLRLTVETNQAGPVKIELFKYPGHQSQKHTLIAKHVNGNFLAKYEEVIEVDTPTNFAALAREVTNEAFSSETPWENILLTCTGAGGQGLTF